MLDTLVEEADRQGVRELLEDFVRAERDTGHKFLSDLSLAELAEEVDRDALEPVEAISDEWNM